MTVDRLRRWHRPGLTVMGDAAYAMSPLGGIGIDLAIKHAVATANALGGADSDPLLRTIRRRRMLPVRLTQRAQQLVQDRIVVPLLGSTKPMKRPPPVARLLDRFALLRRIPARLVGMGVRPEHVRSPDAGERR